MCGWVASPKKMTSMTAVSAAPTTMKGLRTLSASESKPTTINERISAVQNQVFSPLACVTVKLVPLGFLKMTG